MCAGLPHRFRQRVEHRHVEVSCAAFPWRNARDNLGAVLDHLLRVKTSLAPGEPLDDNPCCLIDEYAHMSEVEAVDEAEEAEGAEEIKEKEITKASSIPSKDCVSSFPTSSDQLSMTQIGLLKQSPSRTCQLYNLLGSIFHPVSNREAESRLPQDFLTLFDVSAFHADHHRHLDLQLLRCAHHAGGQNVAA